MTAPRLVGLFVVLIGLLSGTVLVAQPFVAPLEASPLVMGLLFPACLLVGLPLYAAGPERGQALRMAGGALVALGMFALLGLFVDGTGLVNGLRPTLALWLVAPASLVGGLMLNAFANALERVRP